MSEPLKILGIGDGKSPHFCRWATGLARRGHEVHIISTRKNTRPGDQDGLHVHVLSDIDPLLRIPFLRRSRIVPLIAKVGREINADLVHSHYLIPYGMWTAQSGLEPLVVSPWGKEAIVDAWSSPAAEERARTGIAAGRARAYVVNSQALEDCSVRLGADRALFHRIFWHSRIDRHSPELKNRDRWRALGWPDDAVVCLSLRYFRPYTNLDVLLKAFAQAREQVPQLRLFSSAGGGWTRGEFDKLAKELGIEEYMAVQDVPSAELPEVTASADFAVTLADVDSSPSSLLECLASGLPMVAGLAPSIDEWIQTGEGGELVDRHSVDEVAAAMVRIASDAELRKTYSERNLREVHARFGDPPAQLEQVYFEVLGRA